jgi:hypothetical protein
VASSALRRLSEHCGRHQTAADADMKAFTYQRADTTARRRVAQPGAKMLPAAQSLDLKSRSRRHRR